MTFFQSQNVQDEINNIFKIYQKLSYMQNKLASMNKHI